jgi:hypothetical protein
MKVSPTTWARLVALQGVIVSPKRVILPCMGNKNSGEQICALINLELARERNASFPKDLWLKNFGIRC